MLFLLYHGRVSHDTIIIVNLRFYCNKSSFSINMHPSFSAQPPDDPGECTAEASTPENFPSNHGIPLPNLRLFLEKTFKLDSEFIIELLDHVQVDSQTYVDQRVQEERAAANVRLARECNISAKLRDKVQVLEQQIIDNYPVVQAAETLHKTLGNLKYINKQNINHLSLATCDAVSSLESAGTFITFAKFAFASILSVELIYKSRHYKQRSPRGTISIVVS